MAHCSNKHISTMQLFYALKQQYPHASDILVSNCIKQTKGNEEACKGILEAEDALAAPYRSPRRPSSLQLPGKSKEDTDRVSSKSISAPTTPCSITRYVAQSPRRVVQLQLPSPKKLGTRTLIEAQLERKNNLEKELKKDLEALMEMDRQFEELSSLLAERTSSRKIRELEQEIRALRVDCSTLCSEVDSIVEGSKASKRSAVSNANSCSISDDGPQWVCNLCTFLNYPSLNLCESCNMPRITSAGREMPNIQIRVTHHKFPSCAVHSWAL